MELFGVSCLAPRDERVQAQTEALIMAVQDEVILPRTFRTCMMGKAISPAYRVCTGAPETVGHILSSYAPLQWTLYKERHDRVLHQIIRMLAAKHDILLPSDLQWAPARWKGVGILERKDLKLYIDISVPMDQQLSATRLDLVVYSWHTKVISILEVACAWEPLVLVREKEKRANYQEFTKDLAMQHRGWKVLVHPW